MRPPVPAPEEVWIEPGEVGGETELGPARGVGERLPRFREGDELPRRAVECQARLVDLDLSRARRAQCGEQLHVGGDEVLEEVERAVEPLREQQKAERAEDHGAHLDPQLGGLAQRACPMVGPRLEARV